MHSRVSRAMSGFDLLGASSCDNQKYFQTCQLSHGGEQCASPRWGTPFGGLPRSGFEPQMHKSPEVLKKNPPPTPELPSDQWHPPLWWCYLSKAPGVFNSSRHTWPWVWREVNINFQAPSFSQCSIIHKENKLKNSTSTGKRGFYH